VVNCDDNSTKKALKHLIFELPQLLFFFFDQLINPTSTIHSPRAPRLIRYPIQKNASVKISKLLASFLLSSFISFVKSEDQFSNSYHQINHAEQFQQYASYEPL
jgi:hypothetical protein